MRFLLPLLAVPLLAQPVAVGIYDTVAVPRPENVLKATALEPELRKEGFEPRALVLAGEPQALDAALEAGRSFLIHPKRCEGSGVIFIAVNNLGVYQIGETIPMAGRTQLRAQLPCVSLIKVYREDALVHEASGVTLEYAPEQPGSYRLEAFATQGDSPQRWLVTNPIRLETPKPETLKLPPMTVAGSVEVVRGVSYTGEGAQTPEKHKLDVYRPNGGQNLPVLFFVHGGAWRNGDRALYPALGSRFAQDGFVVVIPSYRLSPAVTHPGHMEDVAAAFAWTVRNIAAHGGDVQRIHVAGHSAGGHLVSLLALDERYLAKHNLSSRSIRSVVTISGVYNVAGQSGPFTADNAVQKEASPLTHLRTSTPPFLVAFCQWDYAFLPAQARLFQRELKAKGNASELLYIPGENHISEVIALVAESNATREALVRFMKRQESPSAGI